MDRRKFLKTTAGSAAFSAVQSPFVQAQAAWPAPGRTIKVIVPFPPGAANDALGRLLGRRGFRLGRLPSPLSFSGGILC